MNHYISILIADDDADDAAFLNEAISQHLRSYQVFYAKDGAQTLRFLRTNPVPELIFLDLEMPLRNGLECLKAIKEMPELENTRVVIYAASHNYRDIDKAYKSGADFYIVKPVTLNAMSNIIGKLLEALGKPKGEITSRSVCID